MSTRREFVLGGSTALLSAALPLDALAGEQSAALADDPHRPQFHFVAPHGWMNDPNGPIVWHGKTHLFYQYNQSGGSAWGDMSWGHAVSADMLHWQHMPIALPLGASGSADSYGVFSGSCIADGDRCLAFYTAVAPSPNPEEATLVGRPQREQQCVAVSTDADLRHWTKQAQPVLAKPPLPHIAGFRDPSVWRDGKYWYMVVGSGQVNGEGMVLLYRATVPNGPRADWTYLHPLISGPGNGTNKPNTVDAGTMWECPDLFKLDGHHVLLYSTERKVFWMTGELTTDLRFVSKQRGMLDTGAFYAPKSMVGPHGERVLWGWITEKRPKKQYVAAGWAGCMALPRVLNVDAQGQLRMRVAPAAASLLARDHTAVAGVRNASVSGLAARMDARLPEPGATLTLSLSNGSVNGPMTGEQLLLLKSAGPGKVEVNGQVLEAPLTDGVTAWIDGSVIELFFGDHAAHTLRVYPKAVSTPMLEAVVSRESGGSVTLTKVTAVSPNRLTS